MAMMMMMIVMKVIVRLIVTLQRKMTALRPRQNLKPRRLSSQRVTLGLALGRRVRRKTTVKSPLRKKAVLVMRVVIAR